MKARPILWTAATVRKRRADGDLMFAYLRRYLGRLLVALTLVAPLLIVLTFQLAPGRTGRDGGDDGVRIAAAAESSEIAANRIRMAALIESDRERGQPEREAGVELAWLEPVRPIAWYRVAASEHSVSPYLLEALHQVESSAAPDGCWPNAEGSGAIGPFQFKRATFETYGLDGNGDGLVDICGFSDSLVSAAHYLRALGADEDVESPGTRYALERYGTDAERVISLARYYSSRDGNLTAVTAVTR
jgi:hypothetical protein